MATRRPSRAKAAAPTKPAIVFGDSQGRELYEVIEASLGRAPEDHEVAESLLNIAREDQSIRAEARAKLKDVEKMVAKWEKSLTTTKKQREELQAQYGLHVWGDDRRRKASSVVDALPEAGSHGAMPGRVQDELVMMRTRWDQPPNYDVSNGPRTRSVINMVPIREDVPLDQPTGITGTPFINGTPYVETQEDMQPYNARGYLYNPGEYDMYARSNSIVMESIKLITDTLASSTCEATVPKQLTASVADRLGIDRDDVARRAEDFNLAFSLGRWSDKPQEWLKEAFNTTIINGYSTFEMLLNQNAASDLDSIKALAPRLPNTHLRWIQDIETGKALYIQQVNPNPYVRQPGQFLDMSRVIHFRMNPMGDNFEGVSPLRACRAWDQLTTELILAVIMHVQRFGTGIPIIKRRGDSPSTKKSSAGALNAISTYMNYIEAAIEVGADVDVEILQMQLQNANIEGVIEVCSRMTRAALGASISGMGTGESGGSYNLGDVKSQMFMHQLHSTASTFEAGMNKLIRYWCDHRYGGTMRVYPTFEITGFASRSAKEVLEAQTLFVGLTGRPMSPEELMELRDRTDVVHDGVGEEKTTGEGGELTSDGAGPQTTETPAADTPPPEAAMNAGRALSAMDAAEDHNKGLAGAKDIRIARKIASGKPLSGYEMMALRVWFETFGDPTEHADYERKGTSYQDYMGHGGDAMKEWLVGDVKDIDGDDADTTFNENEVDVDLSVPRAVHRRLNRMGVTETMGNRSALTVQEWRNVHAAFGEMDEGTSAWRAMGGTLMRDRAAVVVKTMTRAKEHTDDAHCGCGVDHGKSPRTRARKWITVKTRTGTWRAWRALTKAEENVAWEQIEEMRNRAATLMERALEREQRAHRAAYLSQAAPFIKAARKNDAAALASLSGLSVDWTASYRNAILDVLAKVSGWSAKDMAAEIAASVNASWAPVPQQLPNADPLTRIRAFAESVAVTANARMNETLRTATANVGNGAKTTLLSAPAVVGVNRTLMAMSVQSISETINQTRQETVLALGPAATGAQFSALMDKWTCQECASNDEKSYRVGTDAYDRDSPPYRLCYSLINSKGQGNLCQCVWVYRFSDAAAGEMISKAAGIQGLAMSTRARIPFDHDIQYRSRVTLLVGLPGTGKSTYAQTLAGDNAVVIDRDDFVLTPEGYRSQGRVESIRAMADALAAGKDVIYVACLLSPDAREKMVDVIDGMTNGEVEVGVVQTIASADHVRKVNEGRADQDRGSIPTEQLEHIIDAWSPVEEIEPFDSVQTLII